MEDAVSEETAEAPKEIMPEERDITIRPASVRDVVMISNFIPKIAEELGGLHQYSQEKFIYHWLRWLAEHQNYAMLGAWDGEALVGFIGGSVVPQPLTSHVFAKGDFWYVELPYRQKGIGKLLLDAFSSWAKSNSATHIVMNVVVGEQSKHLTSFYKKERFQLLDSQVVRRA